MSRDSDNRHLPVPDSDTEGFWQAASEGRLVCRECDACGRLHHYPRPRCPHCLSDDLSWKELSGRGRVYGFTIVRQAASRAFRDRVPYVLALIDLDEGPRMMANIEGDPDAVEVGSEVAVTFRREAEDVAVPVFELTS